LDWSPRERKRLATELHDHLPQILVVGDQPTIQTPGDDATMWQHQGHNLAERQGPFFWTTFSRHLRIRPVPGAMAPRSYLEALMNVAFQAKEWMTAHTLKH